MSKLLSTVAVLLLATAACKKDDSPRYHYFEVGITHHVGAAETRQSVGWRDTAFIVATTNEALAKQALEQLKLPVSERKHVNGALVRGDGGYNKNGSHNFKWHMKEDDWKLADMSAELLDGRPYTDVDKNLNYWVDTVKRFAPWNAYIKNVR
jgi:hypothetical protein